jgi:hypothetical protein
MTPVDFAYILIFVLASGIVYATWRSPACYAAAAIDLLIALVALHVGPFG